MQKVSVWVPTLTQVYNIITYQQVLSPLYFSSPLLLTITCYALSVIISSGIPLFDQNEEGLVSA